MGIGRARRGVGAGRGRHGAGGHAERCGHLPQRGDGLGLLVLAIIEGSRMVEAHQIVDGFDAGSHRHSAGRGVGDLGVGGVGFGRRQIGEGLPGQHVGFAVHAALLPFKNAGGGHGGKPHAVADHQNDVFGAVGVWRLFQPLLQLSLRLKEVRVFALRQLRVVRCAGGCRPAGE